MKQNQELNDAACAGINALVVKLIGNDEKVDKLLFALNDISQDIDTYEYGLPLSDEGNKELLRKAILKWLAGLSTN
jgi:hypothetical protein